MLRLGLGAALAIALGLWVVPGASGSDSGRTAQDKPALDFRSVAIES